MVQLLPREKIGISKKERILFYSSFILLLISISIYIFLVFTNSKLTKKIGGIEKSTEQIEKSDSFKSGNEVKELEKKMNSFSFILKKHSYPFQVFTMLENDTLPKVYFTKFDLNPGNLSLILNGSTNNFQTLGEQILIFKRDPLIKNVSLTSVRIMSLGMINFGFNISLSPQAIQYKKQ